MRKYYIDRIRVMTIILVVVYHVIYIYNSVIKDGVIGPVTQFHGLDAIQYVLYPWFMVILFLISGMCSRYYLETHTEREYFRARTRKLLVPSTIGLFVIGWMQGYLNMSISHVFDGMTGKIPGVIFYLILCLSGTGVLWTIQVMWVCSVVLLIVRRIEKGRLLKAGEHAGIAVLVLL
ncbi:MAG: acyltransferase family protein, partial [Roseburia porci]|nr:acyltransferase family protein [Roseburia porci]